MGFWLAMVMGTSAAGGMRHACVHYRYRPEARRDKGSREQQPDMFAIQFVRRRYLRLQSGFAVAVVDQAIHKQAVAYQISHGSSGHRKIDSLSAGAISCWRGYRFYHIEKGISKARFLRDQSTPEIYDKHSFRSLAHPGKNFSIPEDYLMRSPFMITTTVNTVPAKIRYWYPWRIFLGPSRDVTWSSLQSKLCVADDCTDY